MTGSGAVEVREVTDAAGVNDFLRVPYPIYANDPNWVPPLDFERKQHLSPKSNPYFEHAEAQLFIAWKDGKPVGRISAQIDHLRLERYKDATGQFGHLEAPDDGQIFAALFKAAEDWLRSKGMTRAEGPFSFSINQESGLLIRGYDRPPKVMMGHALPYYAPAIEALGYAKTVDLTAYDHPDNQPLSPAFRKIIERAKRSGKLKMRNIRKSEMKAELDLIMDIFNDAWSDNWGFVPMTDAEIEELGKNLKLLTKKEFICIAEWEGEPAAMCVTIPNVNAWIHDLNGKLVPFGWAKLLWRMFVAPLPSIRMPLTGVRKKYHNTPTGLALAVAVIDNIRAYHGAAGTAWAELSWVLEGNVGMRRIIESFGGIDYKTYRVYSRDIA